MKQGGAFDEVRKGIGWVLVAVGGEGEERLDFADAL